jgi:hypothetical protein
MGFQQMPELADRGLIGHGFTAQINPDKLSQGAGVLQGLLDRQVRQVEPLLQEMEGSMRSTPTGGHPGPSALR